MIPLTPLAALPIDLASFSSKKTALPDWETSMMNFSPSVKVEPTNSSSGSSFIALFPTFHCLLNSSKEVFFTTPFFVAMKTNPGSSNDSTFNKLVILSPSSKFIKFISGLPLAILDAAGI